MDPSILIFDTASQAAAACGDRILEILEEARRSRGVAAAAVSGGSTPRLMFQSMASRAFAWANVELFQVDERCVPPDHELSNYRMMRETLLNAVAIDESRVHRVRGELPPGDAAGLYAAEIRRVFQLSVDALPAFDVIQRGMGPDAHTASLFPGEPLILDRTGIAAAVHVEKMKQDRVTLLPGVLEKARHTLCLVSGADKAGALRRVLREPIDPLSLPSQLGLSGAVWYVDKSAAAQL
ncbi:MAG TPA: 6-phosphogluconolactonase [Bryobacteraceae bacterium]|jgi:6-phosphogluconolactonase|nr:6-phosphogluconolactonase [Bryobacteraceae bacterium]